MLCVLALGIAVRVPFLGLVSGDVSTFVLGWFAELDTRGLPGLASTSSNYEPPYLLLLWAATHLPLAPLLAIKVVSVAAECALALVAARLVALVRRGWWPYVGATAVLLTPTVVLNGAAWGQCDAVYAAPSLAALDAALRRRPTLAAVWLGLAVAVKPQAIFMVPALLAVVLVQRQPLRRVLGAALVAPVMFVACLLPSVMAGSSFSDLVMLYPAQLAQGGVAWGATGSAPPAGDEPPGVPPGAHPAPEPAGSSSGGFDPQDSAFRGGLTYNAASVYQWLPTDAPRWWGSVGYGAAAASVFIVGCWVVRRRDRVRTPELLVASALLANLVPFFLPGMHDRYFFLADVLTVVAAVAVPWAWPAAVLVQAGSLATYLNYLWSLDVPLAPATGAMALGAVLLMVRAGRGRQDVRAAVDDDLVPARDLDH